MGPQPPRRLTATTRNALTRQRITPMPKTTALNNESEPLMTPTFLGRWQTRLALLATVGVVWTALLTPLLPRGDASLGATYRLTMLALAITAVGGGLLWDPIYHGLMQFRWEKDWPSLFALLTGGNEATTTWFVLRQVGHVPTGSFVVLFTTTWLLVWLVVVGPVRVVLLRRRFRGGRVLGA